MALTAQIDGTADNDTLTGGAEAELILGLGGNDRLNGLAGDDTLDGGAGTNQIDAGDGNDTIVIDGTAVNGVINGQPIIPATGIDGGAGVDTLQFAAAVANYHIVQVVGGFLTVTDLTTGARSVASNVEHLVFADSEIWLVPQGGVTGDFVGAVTEDSTPQATGQLAVTAGDPAAAGFVAVTALAGLYGSLTMDGTGAWTYDLTPHALAVQELDAGATVQDVLTVQTLDGTAAQVTITVTGTADTGLVIGTEAREALRGSTLAEQIWGLGGNDRLIGRAGDDVVTGGAGLDEFVFAGRFGHDIITDFDVTLRGEVINLRNAAGINGFADLKTHHLSEVDGHAVITSGTATITLEGITAASLTAHDFLF